MLLDDVSLYLGYWEDLLLPAQFQIVRVKKGDTFFRTPDNYYSLHQKKVFAAYEALMLFVVNNRRRYINAQAPHEQAYALKKKNVKQRETLKWKSMQ